MNTKDKILKIAVDLYFEKDYNLISLNLIAEKVGIKKPSLYYYFKSKDELYREVVYFILAKLEEEFNGIILQDISAKEKLKKFIYGFLFFGHKKIRNLKNFFMDKVSRNDLTFSKKLRQDILEKIEIILKDFKKEKKVDFNEKDLAIFILGALSAFVAEKLLGGEEINENELKKIIDKVILTLLKQYE